MTAPPAAKTGSLTITPKPPTVTPTKTIVAPKGAKQVLGDTAKGQATAKIFAKFDSDKNTKPLQLGIGIYSQGKEYAFTNTPSAKTDAHRVTYFPGTTTIGKNGKRTCTGKVAVKNDHTEIVYGQICEAKIPGRRFGWNLTTEQGKTDLTTAPSGTIPEPKNPARLTVAGAPTQGKHITPTLTLNDLPARSRVAMGGQGKPDAQVYTKITGEGFQEDVHFGTQVVDANGQEQKLVATNTRFDPKDGTTPIQQTVYTYTPGKNGKPATIVRNVYDKNGKLNAGATTRYTVGSESSTAGGRWTLGSIKLTS
jgi:hypothetical protein